MKNNFKFIAAALVMSMSANQASAQANLGADCGCPPVASRPVVNLSTLTNASDEFIASTQTLTCDKTWILDKKIYVDSTKTLVIQPGTVIKGGPSPTGQPADATALVVERGAKIFASGTASCPIVFTAINDPMDGTYGISNRGQWGGVVILGNASNNLTLANATSTFGGTCTGSGCNGTGVGKGFIEGFNAADARNQYGGGTTPNDDDNSGILKYVSIRHAGAILSAGNELNGLSLGSVGRGTTLENIEVIANDDDGIEFFGGTVNLKYASVMFCNDDMYDWDQGYTGKMQFLFGLAADSTVTPTADNGFEADGDDKTTNATPKSNPKVYNVTLIGNYDYTMGGDQSAHAAINGKEFTDGQVYNSVFANWKHGVNLRKTLGAGRTAEVYNNWINGTFQIGCNTFTNVATQLVTDANSAGAFTAALSSDLSKLAADGNLYPASIAGFDYTYTMNATTNAVSDRYDAVPTPNLATTCTAPVDNFFSYANYRGAFDAGKKSWLSDWAYASALQITAGLVACPTDINGDGTTNNSDFLQLLGKFNQSCN